MEKTKNKTVKVYMCGVDWQHEIGETLTAVYSCVEDLKAKSPCWEQCGIVECEVMLKGWVEPQDLGRKTE